MKRHPLSQRFHEILKEIGDLHDQKQADYGSDQDPFHNINAARAWAIEPWIAAMLRLGEKVQRLKSLVRNGRLRNESAIDSMNDIAVYAIIARLLFEKRGKHGRGYDRTKRKAPGQRTRHR